MEKIENLTDSSPIDSNIKVKNSQYSIVIKSVLAMFFGIILTVLPVQRWKLFIWCLGHNSDWNFCFCRIFNCCNYFQ